VFFAIPVFALDEKKWQVTSGEMGSGWHCWRLMVNGWQWSKPIAWKKAMTFI